MNEWHPTSECTVFISTQLGNSKMERQSSISCVGMALSASGPRDTSEEVFIKAIRNFGAIVISNRPVTFAVCKVSKEMKIQLHTTSSQQPHEIRQTVVTQRGAWLRRTIRRHPWLFRKR